MEFDDVRYAPFTWMKCKICENRVWHPVTSYEFICSECELRRRCVSCDALCWPWQLSDKRSCWHCVRENKERTIAPLWDRDGRQYLPAAFMRVVRALAKLEEISCVAEKIEGHGTVTAEIYPNHLFKE